jgi:hypothetical protein
MLTIAVDDKATWRKGQTVVNRVIGDKTVRVKGELSLISAIEDKMPPLRGQIVVNWGY